jgi:hypothetical protein
VYGQLRLSDMVSVKFAARPRVCAVLCERFKQAANFSVHQDSALPGAGIQEISDIDDSVAEISISFHHEQIPRSSSCNAVYIKWSVTLRTLADAHRLGDGKL